jgi:hypothetical protein
MRAAGGWQGGRRADAEHAAGLERLRVKGTEREDM